MLGRLMISLEGTTISTTEQTFLQNKNIGGIILFSRNYSTTHQLKLLITAIRKINPNLLIAVDHEGGRVWRFTSGFTPIPAMKTLGDTYVTDPELALERAYSYGYTIASQLREYDIDFSFTPVLDMYYKHSPIIGDRAFSACANTIYLLAAKLIDGLKDAGMISIGKHFPGHGYALTDSHLSLSVDKRSLAQMSADITPYKMLANELDAVMTAHILYPKFDSHIATFSQKWLTYLRAELGFDGIIFSDDLSMAGAKIITNVTKRIHTAIDAGCDMVLLCNDPQAIHQALESDYPKHQGLHILQGT